VPKVSIYLPDELYQRAREQGLKLSSLTQAAVEQHLERDPNGAWLREAATRAPRFDGAINTADLLDEVRDGFDA
jgi:post-segregation antitoxin (ccd killing protein)